MQGASSLQAALPASHTRSCAPARGYPSCTHGQDAANATRHCNTQPVCWPQREPSAAPLAGTGPAGAQPPSSEHPRGLAASTHLGVRLCTRDLVPGSPGTLHTRGLGPWGQFWAFCPADWGSACLRTWLSGKLVPPRGSGRAGGFEALPPGVRRCQSVPPAAHQPLPAPTEQGPPFVPGSSHSSPGLCTLGSRVVSELPFRRKAAWLEPGRPAFCSGVDLLCDFWISHVVSLNFTISLWGSGENQNWPPCAGVGKVAHARNQNRLPGLVGSLRGRGLPG